MENKAEIEQANREFEDALSEEIEARVKAKADLTVHALAALRAAGCELNCELAEVLTELGALIHEEIHSMLSDD